jgi:hypothetical protein
MGIGKYDEYKEYDEYNEKCRRDLLREGTLEGWPYHGFGND